MRNFLMWVLFALIFVVLTPAQTGAGARVNSRTPEVTLHAQDFPGANAGAKINACNAAAIALGGATCDDTAVLTLDSTSTAQIEIGDNISGFATVRHIFPSQFALRASLHDPAKCAVRVWNRGILDGQGLSAGGSRANIFPAAGSSMQALLCTDTSDPNAQNYMRIWGVSAVNDNGSAMRYAVDIEDLGDQSIYGNSYANNQTGNTMYLANLCCAMVVTAVHAFGSNLSGPPNSTGGTALTLGGYGYIAIDHSTFNRPRNGAYNVDIQGYWQLRLDDAYMEGNGLTDGTTGMVNIGPVSTGFSSVNSEVSPCVGCDTTKPAYVNNSRYNWSLLAAITGGKPGVGVAMKDNITGRSYLSAGERNMNPPMFGGPGPAYFDNLSANEASGFNLNFTNGTIDTLAGGATSTGTLTMPGGATAVPFQGGTNLFLPTTGPSGYGFSGDFVGYVSFPNAYLPGSKVGDVVETQSTGRRYITNDQVHIGAYFDNLLNTYVFPNGAYVGSLEQTGPNTTGGTCTMHSATACTFTIGKTYTTPICIATQQSGTLTGGSMACTVSGAVVTITTATTNSETWGALVFGNPN
jgi:hypothetical protein